MKTRGRKGQQMLAQPTCSLKGFMGTQCKISNLIFASFQYDRLYIPTVLIFLIFLEQIPTQEHIITQWTSIQAELATFTLPQVGSISHFSEDAGAIIGKLSTAGAEGLSDEGPFTEAWDYFAAVAEAKFYQACKSDIANDGGNIFTRLGPSVFEDIVHNTALFKTGGGPFHFNHMDMGTQNILVDQDFNFLAIIDWEFAQTAPWEVNHYPMPFPLISADAKINYILQNPDHIAHRNVSRQVAARKMYRQKF